MQSFEINNNDDFEQCLYMCGITVAALPISGIDECGQNVIIGAYRKEDYNPNIYGSDVVYFVQVSQANDCVEVTHYHPDGTVETTYDKVAYEGDYTCK